MADSTCIEASRLQAGGLAFKAMDVSQYHPPKKYSVRIEGHRTSISLEPLFWDMLRIAAEREGLPINTLVAQIDAERIRSDTPPGLASAIRVWLVLNQKGGGIAPTASSINIDE